MCCTNFRQIHNAVTKLTVGQTVKGNETLEFVSDRRENFTQKEENH